mgnify:FL=1
MSLYETQKSFSNDLFFTMKAELPDPSILVIVATYEDIKPYLTTPMFDGFKYEDEGCNICKYVAPNKHITIFRKCSN